MSQRTVLIVDDDASIRAMVRSVLAREGYAMEEVASCSAAVSNLKRRSYDAVVLDIMMGSGSGLEVLDEIATQAPDVKCVVVISASSPANIAKIETANVAAKLRKPFDIQQLVDAVHDCVKSRSDEPRTAPCIAPKSPAAMPISSMPLTRPRQ